MILSKRSASGLATEAKMDELYSIILEGCDWMGEDFVKGYHLFLGTIVVAKSPVSMSTLQSLHRNTPELRAREALAPIWSLLAGLDNQDRPIRVLRLSLQEFLVSRERCKVRFYLHHLHW